MTNEIDEETEATTVSRRNVLLRVGLLATAAYSVPAFTTLSVAHAGGRKRKRNRNRRRNRNCNSGPSGSRPSNSGPSCSNPSNSGPSGSGPSGSGPSGSGPSGSGPSCPPSNPPEIDVDQI